MLLLLSITWCNSLECRWYVFLLGCKDTNVVDHSIFLKLMQTIHLDGNGTQPSPLVLGKNRENANHPSHQPFDARDYDILVRLVYFYNNM